MNLNHVNKGQMHNYTNTYTYTLVNKKNTNSKSYFIVVVDLIYPYFCKIIWKNNVFRAITNHPIMLKYNILQS